MLGLVLLFIVYLFRPACICFDFPEKLHVHISGRQNKNKLKEKQVEISEQLVRKVLTSLHASFVSVDFGRNMPDSCAAFMCKNRRSTSSLQFYHILQKNDILSKE